MEAVSELLDTFMGYQAALYVPSNFPHITLKFFEEHDGAYR